MPAKTNCACGRKMDEASCFTINELRSIAKAMRGRGVEIRGNTKRELYDAVLDAMACDGDRCLSAHSSLPEDIKRRLREALVPLAPREWISNPTAWLSNFDIQAKCDEIMRVNKHVLFIGVLPMDAEHNDGGRECVSQALCDYHPVKARKTHSAFAVVFNTDYHGMPGSHWVAAAGFVDPKNPRYGLYYYDSVGNRPTGDIDRFVTRISKELEEADGKQPPYMFNDVKHQRSNTECGMFCLAFIDGMFNTDRTYTQMCNRLVSDADMIRRRTEYFEVLA